MKRETQDLLFDLPDFPGLPLVPQTRVNNKAVIRAWKKEHRISTHHGGDCEEAWMALGPDLTMEDVAEQCFALEEDGQMVYGRTEQQACERLAQNLGISIAWASHRAQRPA